MKYKLTNDGIYEDYGEQILRLRGIEDVELFLNPDESCLQSYHALDNVDEGVNFIRQTVFDEKPYALICDADADGLTSSGIIYQYIKRLNPVKHIIQIIHSGKQHGCSDVMDKLLERSWSGVLIPDAGSNDGEYIKQLDCPVLVLDHHELEPASEIPSNMILINNQTSSAYQNKDLCGAGVVWQFCHALDDAFGHNWAWEYTDLAALGIISDMVSMLSYENQFIVQQGCANIQNFFLKILVEKQSYSMGGEVNPTTVAFYITPLINAMIRVGSQDEKKRLYRAVVAGEELVPSGKRGAKGTLEKLAIESARECTNAKSHQDKAKEKATEQLEYKIHKYDLLENKILFVKLDDDDNFPPELNGLIATQLSARYHKPTMIGREGPDGMIKGSIRGLSQSALTSFKDYLLDTGLFDYVQGHSQAAGYSLPADSYNELLILSNAQLAAYDFGDNNYDVDFVRKASNSDISNIIFDLARYERVWGQNNPQSLIAITNLYITPADVKVIGKNQDTIRIEKNGITYIKFRAKDLIEKLHKWPEMCLTIVGKPNINEWLGNYTPQLQIVDVEVENAEWSF